MGRHQAQDTISRRRFLASAAAFSAYAAWAVDAQPSQTRIRENRDAYPEGVASGDPDASSVMLWTRRPYSDRTAAGVRVEVSEDASFGRVIARAHAKVSAAADWTCRVLVGNLRPARVYWYRFIDEEGNASRVGRTITAPADDDPRPVKFAFASCQDLVTSALNAYRRMIFEDERAAESDRLGFVLHLGDFIYEVVGYPEDNPNGVFNRRIVKELVRYPHGQKIHEGRNVLHIPTTLEDYRAVYRAFLHDPDLQEARARWPFVCMWDNHEFSIWGWQSVQFLEGENRSAQTRKVAASQAWFEYVPARVTKSDGPSLDAFTPPHVEDAPIARFDADGFGDEPNNRRAVASLTIYRALRWGRNLELVLTDQHSYRSEDPVKRKEADALRSREFPSMFPEEALEILDAGAAYADGHPPDFIRSGGREVPNFRKKGPPRTILGKQQKKWFLDRLKASTATWKVWANSEGTLDKRSDPQNLPTGVTAPWHGAGYAGINGVEPDTAYVERAEIYATVRAANITGFATVCGNRHSFWAGLAAPSLPPRPFEPIGVAFVTGAISSANWTESVVDDPPGDHPLRPLFAADRASGAPPELSVNLLFHHGVQSALEYSRTGDLARALALSNPELAPHIKFLDMGGHGYSTVRVTSDALECEFVCIPPPLERATTSDGGPLRYRVVHRVPLWKPGDPPRLEQRVIEGSPALSL